MLTKRQVTESTQHLMYLIEEQLLKEYNFTENDINNWLLTLEDRAPELVYSFCLCVQNHNYTTPNIIKALLKAKLNEIKVNTLSFSSSQN
jgi:hypothetical protein